MVRKVIRLIGTQIKDIIEMMVFYGPGIGGNYLRRRWIKKKCKKTGVGICFGIGSRIESPENIEIGNSVIFGRNSFLQAGQSKIKIGNFVSTNVNVFIVSGPNGEISIGDNVLIGPNVVMRAADHNFKDIHIPIRQQGHISGRITIGNDVWIGGNVVITKDVTIGEHSIIGAGSVVINDVEPFSIMAGVPAKLIRKRK
jgi:galactoside O-acetyltransferase